MHPIISEIYDCIAEDNNITIHDFISLCEAEKLFIEFNSSVSFDECTNKQPKKIEEPSLKSQNEINDKNEIREIIGYKCKCGKIPNTKPFYTNKKWLIKHIDDKGQDGHEIIEIYK